MSAPLAPLHTLPAATWDASIAACEWLTAAGSAWGPWQGWGWLGRRQLCGARAMLGPAAAHPPPTTLLTKKHPSIFFADSYKYEKPTWRPITAIRCEGE